MKIEDVRRIIKNTKQPTKRQFVVGFFVIVAILGGIRYYLQSTHTSDDAPVVEKPQKYHRIRGVTSYKAEFPDSQSVQIVAAQKWGVRPVKNREDAESRKKELVYVGESPY
jgi:hypothetical protein